AWTEMGYAFLVADLITRGAIGPICLASSVSIVLRVSRSNSTAEGKLVGGVLACSGSWIFRVVGEVAFLGSGAANPESAERNSATDCGRSSSCDTSAQSTAVSSSML